MKQGLGADGQQGKDQGVCSRRRGEASGVCVCG
jgi:hypothetical protein